MKHIVGFSGGIDSQACARWVLNRFPKEDVILLNSDAGGHEHPLTTQFIRDYSEKVHPVVMITPIIADLDGRAKEEVAKRGLKQDDPLTFGLLAELKKIFPSRRVQFCTQHLKIEPSLRWMKANVTDAYCRYTGIRRGESGQRSTTPYQRFDEYFDCDLFCPIMDWTKEMCFDYVKAHGEEVNPLYRMGFTRVGCAPCIYANKEDVRQWATRAPDMIDKVREWEGTLGKPFFASHRDNREPVMIDEVVAWSKTERGGKQLSILADVVEPCESKYGLCE